MVMSAEKIISKYGVGPHLSTSASYYAGRGNNPGDLNSAHLENIYYGVKFEIGEKAAKAFVNMVGEMTDDASASTFINAFYNLERVNWSFKPSVVPQSNTDSLAQSIQDAQRRGVDDDAILSSFFGAFAHIQGGSLDRPKGDGLRIIRSFLQNHKDELEESSPFTNLDGVRYDSFQ